MLNTREKSYNKQTTLNNFRILQYFKFNSSPLRKRYKLNYEQRLDSLRVAVQFSHDMAQKAASQSHNKTHKILRLFMYFDLSRQEPTPIWDATTFLQLIATQWIFYVRILFKSNMMKKSSCVTFTHLFKLYKIPFYRHYSFSLTFYR